MKRRWLLWQAYVLGIVLLPVPVFACPYCDSEIGREVSKGIFNGDFGQNVLLTLLPIPVMLLIVGLLHLGLPAPKHVAQGEQHERPRADTSTSRGDGEAQT